MLARGTGDCCDEVLCMVLFFRLFWKVASLPTLVKKSSDFERRAGFPGTAPRAVTSSQAFQTLPPTAGRSGRGFRHYDVGVGAAGRGAPAPRQGGGHTDRRNCCVNTMSRRPGSAHRGQPSCELLPPESCPLPTFGLPSPDRHAASSEQFGLRDESSVAMINSLIVSSSVPTLFEQIQLLAQVDEIFVLDGTAK